jgi:hypothetical protein
MYGVLWIGQNNALFDGDVYLEMSSKGIGRFDHCTIVQEI